MISRPCASVFSTAGATAIPLSAWNTGMAPKTTHCASLTSTTILTLSACRLRSKNRSPSKFRNNVSNRLQQVHRRRTAAHSRSRSDNQLRFRGTVPRLQTSAPTPRRRRAVPRRQPNHHSVAQCPAGPRHEARRKSRRVSRDFTADRRLPSGSRLNFCFCRASPLAVRAVGQVRFRDIRVALNVSFLPRSYAHNFAV